MSRGERGMTLLELMLTMAVSIIVTTIESANSFKFDLSPTALLHSRTRA